jgi:uncharacterized lipoprotein NlpE involved in copper resistance
MKKKLLVCLLAVVMCFVLVGCKKSEGIKGDTELNDVYNKVGEYFGDENVDHSNLGAYYLDVEQNVVIIVLVDNSKEKQESFKELVKVDSKYLKFVQGGPYSTSSKK